MPKTAKGWLPVTWKLSDIAKLPFSCRKNYQGTFELFDNTFQSLYNQHIYIYHYTNPAIADILGIQKQFGFLSNIGYSIHYMDAGCILPLHSDQYPVFKEQNKISKADDIVRIVTFLDEWRWGHIMQVDNQLLSSWRAGEWIAWTGTTVHMAANLGAAPRYTLQVTGTGILPDL